MSGSIQQELMNADITLYTNPRSRGCIVHWMLQEVGVRYELRYLRYGDEMRTSDFLRLNPLGKVPVLRHDGRIVTETAAICAYLADAFPEAGLAPSPRRRDRYYRWLFVAAGPLEMCTTHTMCGYSPEAAHEAMLGYRSVAEMTDLMESALTDTSYLAGSSFTAADVYVGAHIGWGMEMGIWERRPALEMYWQRLSARPAYRKAKELDAYATEELSARESGITGRTRDGEVA